MSVFDKLARKTVETVKDAASEIATEATSEKLDIWTQIATIGIFLLIGGSSVHSSFHHKPDKLPDFRTMIINNYYTMPKEKR